MTVVPKSALRRSLSYTELLDTNTGGPFVGLHLGEVGKIHLRRTSPLGYIETEGAPHPSDPGWIYAHLEHMQDSLRYLESENIDVLRMKSGTLMMRTVNSMFDTEMRVHTVPKSHSGLKMHSPGDSHKETDVSWLQGLDLKPFTPLSMPPMVDGTKIILSTSSGTVFWDTGVDPELPSSPRETFIRALDGVSEGQFTLTKGGYFAACFNEMVFCIASHPMKFPHQVPTVDGAVKLTEVSATRLIFALKSAASLAAPGVPVTIMARGGVITRNEYSQPVRFGLGDLSAFMPFDLFYRSAQVIAAALDQAKGDEVTLYRMANAQDRLLFHRGNCMVAVQGAASSLQP